MCLDLPRQIDKELHWELLSLINEWTNTISQPPTHILARPMNWASIQFNEYILNNKSRVTPPTSCIPIRRTYDAQNSKRQWECDLVVIDISKAFKSIAHMSSEQSPISWSSTPTLPYLLKDLCIWPTYYCRCKWPKFHSASVGGLQGSCRSQLLAKHLFFKSCRSNFWRWPQIK